MKLVIVIRFFELLTGAIFSKLPPISSASVLIAIDTIFSLAESPEEPDPEYESDFEEPAPRQGRSLLHVRIVHRQT